jgi:haloalkane dehalogenase
LVERLDLHDITIVMQDWGGPIGFDLTLRHPERVRGFVIGNTWAWPLERSGHKMFSAIMGGWIGQSMSWAFNGVERFFMWKGVGASLSDAELAMYRAPFAARKDRSPTHIFPAQLSDARPFLAHIYQNLNSLSNRPVLIVWGMKDFAFQEPERKRFEQLFPNHKTVLLEDAAHFIQEDAPVEVCLAIRSWYPGLVGTK